MTRRVALAALASVATAIAVFAVLPAGDGDEPSRTAARASAPDPGRAAFAAAGCGSCHTFTPAGATGTFGPDLDQALDGVSAASVRQTIVDPPRNTIMPRDFGQRLSDQQLDALAAFLTGSD